MVSSIGLFTQKKDNSLDFHTNDLFKIRIDDIDSNGKTAYLATQGNGVVAFGDSIFNITTKNKLTNNIISEIHIENDSTVWACSITGLNRITFKNKNNYTVNTLTIADGLISNDINDIEIINDTIWVATKKGLCYLNKEVLDEKINAKVLSLVIEKIVVNNNDYSKPTGQFNYDQNNISFKLQAVSHKNSKNIIYQYRLKEIDKTWKNTKNRIINFSSLSPGNYTFEARATISNNPNDKVISYTFKIYPPFWKTWWFYSLCSFSFICLVYLFFKIRVLSYNKDVLRELIRLIIKRLKRKEQIYKFRSNGEDFKILTREIQYINSQGNYLDIITDKKTYTIRCKIGDFINTTPDKLEYLRVHRSYIIRIDQVSSKGKNWVIIKEKKFQLVSHI
ncbi:MAG: hypothetical protein HC854_06950 [Flavobacterium sp.]|nr:hypothetical protein [Flavobacterium sp.]